MRPSRVWYLAYGSNLNSARFARYLEGGDTEPGARDDTAPVRSAWAEAGLRLWFAGSSTRWSGGGVAFVAPDPAAQCWVRAWDITAEQFEDVFAQENRLVVPRPLPWDDLLAGSVQVGTGWYCRLLRLDLVGIEDQPALTFTCSPAASGLAIEAGREPHPEYAATIASGLADNPALDQAAIVDYLGAAIRRSRFGR